MVHEGSLGFPPLSPPSACIHPLGHALSSRHPSKTAQRTSARQSDDPCFVVIADSPTLIPCHYTGLSGRVKHGFWNNIPLTARLWYIFYIAVVLAEGTRGQSQFDGASDGTK
jgi:hypothetical protein